MDGVPARRALVLPAWAHARQPLLRPPRSESSRLRDVHDRRRAGRDARARRVPPGPVRARPRQGGGALRDLAHGSEHRPTGASRWLLSLKAWGMPPAVSSMPIRRRAWWLEILISPVRRLPVLG